MEQKKEAILIKKPKNKLDRVRSKGFMFSVFEKYLLPELRNLIASVMRRSEVVYKSYDLGQLLDEFTQYYTDFEFYSSKQYLNHEPKNLAWQIKAMRNRYYHRRVEAEHNETTELYDALTFERFLYFIEQHEEFIPSDSYDEFKETLSIVINDLRRIQVTEIDSDDEAEVASANLQNISNDISTFKEDLSQNIIETLKEQIESLKSMLITVIQDQSQNIDDEIDSNVDAEPATIDSTVVASISNQTNDSADTQNESDSLLWFNSVETQLWYKLAHFAKENDLLSGWERKFLFSMGRLSSSDLYEPSEKQLASAVKVYKKIIENYKGEGV